jgi:hypothetical protein
MNNGNRRYNSWFFCNFTPNNTWQYFGTKGTSRMVHFFLIFFVCLFFVTSHQNDNLLLVLDQFWWTTKNQSSDIINYSLPCSDKKSCSCDLHICSWLFLLWYIILSLPTGWREVNAEKKTELLSYVVYVTLLNPNIKRMYRHLHSYKGNGKTEFYL